MDPIGKSPIPVFFLVLGKLALAGSSLFFFARPLDVEMLYDSPLTQTIAYVLLGLGFVVLVFAFAGLGESVSVGLPRDETELKTKGIYRFTRNPMYLGGYLICAASCIYAIHPANFLLFALAVIIHHRIVLKEERFLEQRFGLRWLEYRQRVPRYLGRIRFEK